MKFFETVGMMATGAALTLGAIYVIAPDTLSGTVTPIVAEAPAAQVTATPEVTRGTTDIAEVAQVSQIATIVSLAERGLDDQQELTPEQQEVVAFFEDTARAMNETSRVKNAGEVQFNNMAVSNLRVLYYYTVPAPYEDLNRSEIMQAQTDVVENTLCQGEAIQTLMQDYGFEYTYTYVSGDNRLIGKVVADAETCI